MADNQDARVKVYWLNQSRAQNILWLLEELGVEYDVEVFHRNEQTMLAPKELHDVHPLGKSPVVEVTPTAEGSEPIKLAESGFIVQYLCDHFPGGERLVPKRWKDGQENRVGGETEAWMRHEYLLHYVEGSLFPILMRGLLLSILQSNKIPFFIRPITSMVAGQMLSVAVTPDIKRNLAMLDNMLENSPDQGQYICGPELTAADILLSFALISAETRLDAMAGGSGGWEGGSARAAHPRVFEYIDRLRSEPGYKRSADKIRELDGEFVATLGGRKT